MANQEDIENQGFKVNDRRRFAPDGTPLKEETTIPKTAEAKRSSPGEAAQDIPVDFSSLLLSLAAGAQSGLGLSPHPLTGKVEKNLTQAKYSIDLLGLLEEKTRGNLQPEEKKLLETLLFDLRMQFLEAKKK